MGRFETALLANDVNIEVRADMNGAWIDKVHGRRPLKMIILELFVFIHLIVVYLGVLLAITCI